MTAPWCGRPADCPVPDPPGPVDARRIGSTVWAADRAFFYVYELHRGCDEFNPGRGAKPGGVLVEEIAGSLDALVVPG